MKTNRAHSLLLLTLLTSELCYYLLIAQTGIVESWGSDLLRLAPLPIGGALGSLFAFAELGAWRGTRRKVLCLLALQTAVSFLYPDFTIVPLFLLGLSVGALAPLILHLFREEDLWIVTIGLALAYGVGTSLFTSEPEGRGLLGIVLSGVALVAGVGLSVGGGSGTREPARVASPPVAKTWAALALLSTWVLLDSALFETLSRSESIAIWRSDLRPWIIASHSAGLFTAYWIRHRFRTHQPLIALLFAASHAAYLADAALALALIYPFAISYYNLVLLRALLPIRDLRRLGLCMFFAGWVASGLGLALALGEWVVLPLVLLAIAMVASLRVDGFLGDPSDAAPQGCTTSTSPMSSNCGTSSAAGPTSTTATRSG